MFGIHSYSTKLVGQIRQQKISLSNPGFDFSWQFGHRPCYYLWALSSTNQFVMKSVLPNERVVLFSIYVMVYYFCW